MRINNKWLLTMFIAALSVSTFSWAYGGKHQRGKAAMQEKYTLYTIPGTCSTGIAVLMHKLGVNYVAIKRDAVPNYRDIVPTNQVPALKTQEGKIITEGGAIALYLLEKHGKEVMPSNTEARAEFYQWFHFDYSTLHPAYGKLFATAGNKNLTDAAKAQLMQDFADSLSNLWAILDQRLAKQKFILGDQPSHVDYMAVVYASWNNFFPNTKITLGENVLRFIKDVQALPEFQAGYAAEGIPLASAS